MQARRHGRLLRKVLTTSAVLREQALGGNAK
jgi:hypothetical protein